MEQVLIRIPIPNPWVPGLEIPIYGFGLMLFLAFITCTLWANWRARKEGVNPQIFQDLVVWIFVGGIIGARITFMIQYGVPLWKFFEIWNGGLVFYGSAIGGTVGYALAYFFVLRKQNVSTRQLADIIAPTVAWGLMLGRIGCFLNGCCYGHVACPDCLSVHFPLGAPPRYALVQQGWQTAAGFTTGDRILPDDPLTHISAVAAGSPAAESGLHPGDVVLKVNGQPNERIVEVSGRPEVMAALAGKLKGRGTVVSSAPDKDTRQFAYPDLASYQADLVTLKREPVHIVAEFDTLWDVLVQKWPRGQKTLELEVEHSDGTIAALPPFEPRTLGLHPTQLYEVVSMFLLFLLLNALFPFRRRYGQIFALLMIFYAMHRFVNEALRNDTDPVFNTGMTLSQNGSILFGVIGIALLIWLSLKPADKGLAPAEPAKQLEPEPTPV